MRVTGRKKIGFALRCLTIAVLAFSVMTIVPETIKPAFAQERAEKHSFNPFAPLLRLFGGGRTQRKKTETKNNRPKRAVGAAPAFVEQPKNPDAGLILVVGDRMARGVGDGLKYLLADKPVVRVDYLTDDRQGFAGANAPDWAAQVLARIRGADVKAVVVMLGEHDLKKPLPGEPPLDYMSDAWLTAYRKKATGLVKTVRQERKPIFWVGLPPTGSTATNNDFSAMNDIFSGLAEDSRSRYIDIWDIFLNEEGSYSAYGPDVDGKNTRLRSGDKIGFTWAGYQKVAFFVERELSSMLGGYGGYAFEGVDDDPNFIVLTGRETPPDEELLGAENGPSKLDKDSVAYRFFVKGESLPSVSGRADNTKPVAAGGS